MTNAELIAWGVRRGLIQVPILSPDLRESQALAMKYSECRERSRLANRLRRQIAREAKQKSP